MVYYGVPEDSMIRTLLLKEMFNFEAVLELLLPPKAGLFSPVSTKPFSPVCLVTANILWRFL